MSITVAGKELIADRLTMTPVSAQPLWIAIGTGSPSATALGSEISRKYCKIVSSSGGIITYSCLWDIEDNIEGLVTEIGIFNQATIAGTLLLCDRLWHNNGLVITTITEQTFTASQIPARDANGSNAGVGVYAALEVTSATGAGVPNPTIKYNNQAGTVDKVGTNLVACVASSIAGTFHPFGLAAGDTGIQKLQSLTLGVSWTSGAISLVLYRVLARLELQAQIGN